MKTIITPATFLKSTMLLGTLSCLVGCPEDEKPTSNPPSNDMSMPDDMTREADMASDMSEDDGIATLDMAVDMSEDMVCVPRTSCEPDVCGSQEDGCGGLLECGMCACVDGQPTETTCGICDLGVSRCEEGVTSKMASCEYPGGEEAIGSITSCASIKYVDLDAPSGGDGTKASPFVSYGEALATFRSGEEGAILMTTGFYVEPLVVRSKIHVFGGFAREFQDMWVKAEQGTTVFTAPVVQGGPTIGMIAHDVSAFTLIHNVLAQALDTAPGESIYGAHLKNSSGLVVDSSRIAAGRGGEGIEGVEGARGADGGDGEPPTCMLVDIGQRASFGGAGGINPSCPEANGGQGGAGAYYTSVLGRVAATDGAPSADGVVIGGDAGRTGSTQGNANASDGLDAPFLTEDGEDGEQGKSGGMIAGDYWVSTGQGEDGEDGSHGSGGSGGGGAGSNLQQPQEIGGGGGAAGGCGGEGGTGGGPGGASFGLLALNSNATFRNSEIWGGIGGRGGRGARGGQGGDRGTYAVGTFIDCSGAARPWRSGNGGRSASGRGGGQGGGGAGGNGYGAYCVESTLTLESSSIEAGQGGTGGGTSANAGEDGEGIRHVECVEEVTP